jgi:hypothetical protein
MAIRKCPQCMNVVSPGVAAAYSDTIECETCKTPLEVAVVTRMIAIWTGLAAGVTTWLSVRGKDGTLGWALVVLLPFLAFAFVSAVITMTTADLRKRAVVAAPEPVADQGHGGNHGAHH